MRLVPFGEYVPLARLLFFAGTLVATVADFSPGLVPATLSVDGHRLSTAICYEVVYPDLIRQFVVGGSELLTTITNDAWFGRTSAPYQHFSQAAMRRDRAGTVSRTCRQHGHQRHRGSVWAGPRPDGVVHA